MTFPNFGDSSQLFDENIREGEDYKALMEEYLEKYQSAQKNNRTAFCIYPSEPDNVQRVFLSDLLEKSFHIWGMKPHMFVDHPHRYGKVLNLASIDAVQDRIGKNRAKCFNYVGFRIAISKHDTLLAEQRTCLI